MIHESRSVCWQQERGLGPGRQGALLWANAAVGAKRALSFCHATTLTSLSEEPGPVCPLSSLPPEVTCIPARRHSQASLLHNFILGDVYIDTYIYMCICMSVNRWWKLTYLRHIDSMWRNAEGHWVKTSLTGKARKIRLGFILENHVEPQLRGLFYSSNTVRLRSFSTSLRIDRQKYGQHGEWDPRCKTGDFHVLPLLNTQLHGAYSTSLQRKLPRLPRELRKKTCRRFPQGNERQ